MPNELLIIIDPQFDFINKEGFYAKKHSGIDQILNAREKINRLISSENKNDLVVVTSDYKEDQFEKGLAICIPGTAGHKVDIEMDGSCTVISKSAHSCFSSEEFKRYLKIKNIDRLVVCGFLAEYCVKATAIDALENGYSVSLLKDCIGTGDDVQDRREQLFYELIEKGAEVI